jgi:hypothetical protein
MKRSIMRRVKQVPSALSYLYCIMACLAASAMARERASSEYNDHLVPFDGIVEPSYQTLLSQKLFLTPGNFVRIVILPSAASKGEVAIAIYSDSKMAADSVTVTCTKAKRNLWYAASDENGGLSKNTSSIEIERSDAVFPKAVAATIVRGATRMLDQCKPLDKTNDTFVDATDIEVLIESSPNKRVRGLLTPHARGRSGSALRALTEILERYCEATPENKKQLLRKIEARANQLAK